MKRILIAACAVLLSFSALAFDPYGDIFGDQTVTNNNRSGTITTTAMDIPHYGFFHLIINNSTVVASDVCMVSVANGSNANGEPELMTVTPKAGSLEVLIGNDSETYHIVGTLKVSFWCK